MPDIFTELKRRNVFRVAVAYVVIGWLLVQVLEVMVDAFEAPGWVLKMIIALLAVGFLPVLAFSWIYELTPEGIKRESEIDRDTSITQHTARKLNLVTIGAVAIVAAFVGWTQLRGPSQPATPVSVGQSADQLPGTDSTAADVLPDEASVAVLPFVNMSANVENQYFADGLTETLLHMLAQVRELKVAARTSSFAFKGQDADIRSIANTLNVAHVLEGSVQRAGERVRITAQLIRASDGFHVWSENYDRTLDDVFRIQDEIATDVRGALSSSLLGDETTAELQSVATDDIEAYDLYLQALAERTKGSYGALQEAERLLKNALAKDAGFLEAMTELALVLWDQSDTGLITQEQAAEQGSALLAQVLASRPQDVRAQTLTHRLKAFELFSGGKIADSFAEVEKLRSLTEQAPSEPLPRIMLAAMYRNTDRLNEAREQLQVLLELDPLNPRHHRALGKILRDQARVGVIPGEQAWQYANRAFRRSLELEPEQPNVHGDLANIALLAGDVVGYVKGLEQAMALDPEDHEIPALVAEKYYDYGLMEIGDRYKAMTDAIAPTSPVARKLELLHAVASNEPGAVERIAQQMLADDIENRQRAWFAAARELFRTAALKEDYEGAIAFMEAHYPGFSDGSRHDLVPQAALARRAAIGTFKEAMSADEFAEFLEGYKDFLVNTARVNLSNNSFSRALLLAAEDKPEEAIEVLINELFSKPESRNFYMRRAFEWEPQLAALKDDPRIAAALARYEDQAAVNRQKLREYYHSNN